jgi:hypothetical protein
VIVDGDVQELAADALDAVAAVTGDTVGGPLDAHQPLAIEVQHVARSGMVVAHHAGVGSISRMRFSFSRRRIRPMVARLRPSCRAIRIPLHR